MGPVWWAVGALLGVAVLVVLLFASRLRTLVQWVGSFDCRIPRAGGAPAQGIAHYGVGRLDWWRLWSLSPRPRLTWARQELVILGHEEIVVPGKTGIYQVHCSYRGRPLELQMSVAAYAGLTSWLESAPPASHGIVA